MPALLETNFLLTMNHLLENLSRCFHPEDEHDELMRRHHEAMDCGDLETVLGVGILYFQHINKYHKKWYFDVEAKRVPYRPEDAEQFANEYTRWMQGAECHLARAKELEDGGYTLNHADKIRELYELVQSANLDVRSSLEAIARLERGEGMALDDFFDAQVQSRN
jgi:hypothetical protein